MTRTKRTQEMELSLYYSRVESHIGHLLPRCEARAALDHLKWHWARLGYSFSSILMPSLARSFARPKVQGGTHASRWFPRISGIAPNRIAPGPVGRVSADLSGQGSHATIYCLWAINAQCISGFFHLFGSVATRRWLGYWHSLPVTDLGITRRHSQSFAISPN
jgi:hypothetical protein